MAFHESTAPGESGRQRHESVTGEHATPNLFDSGITGPADYQQQFLSRPHHGRVCPPAQLTGSNRSRSNVRVVYLALDRRPAILFVG